MGAEKRNAFYFHSVSWHADDAITLHLPTEIAQIAPIYTNYKSYWTSEGCHTVYPCYYLPIQLLTFESINPCDLVAFSGYWLFLTIRVPQTLQELKHKGYAMYNHQSAALYSLMEASFSNCSSCQAPIEFSRSVFHLIALSLTLRTTS